MSNLSMNTVIRRITLAAVAAAALGLAAQRLNQPASILDEIRESDFVDERGGVL